MARVVVVGAGVIGLCAARELRRRGWDVTVLEAGRPGGGASHGNAGWVAPALSDPIPSPGLIGTSLRWMLRPASPLYIRPRADLELGRWLFAFWRSCNSRAFDAGLEATAALNRRTLALYDELERDGIDGEQERRGLIAAYRSPAALARDLRGLERLVSFGQPAPVPLSGDDLRAIEPAVGPAVSGGFHLPAERHVRPDRLCAALVSHLEARGVSIRAETAVTGFVQGTGNVTAVTTPAGDIPAEAVLIAAGAWTPAVARLAGVRVPIQAGKGYSLDFAPPPRPVTHPIYFHETRVAVTPFAGTVRLAGTMELSGLNTRVQRRRVAAIVAAAAASLAGWPAESGGATVWAGMRPLTPDGLPVIGRLPGVDNLFVASGHGMLGVTLAPATAEAVADLVASGTAPEVLAPFDPARFGRTPS